MVHADPILDALREELARHLPLWGLAPQTPLRLLTISENATFLAGPAREGAGLVLRVYRPGYHEADEIASELAWIAALSRERTVETPRLVPTRAGASATVLPGSGRRVAAFAFMEGREPDETTDRLFWFRRIGETTARLHAHGAAWTRPAGFRRKRWDFPTILGRHALWGDWRASDGLDRETTALLERAAARLRDVCEAVGTGPERFGLIHGDLRAANLLVGAGRLGVIDFDDCGFSWRAFDFAASVSFIEEDPALPALRAAWLEGYRAVRSFGPQEEAALPAFTMLRRMQLTAWLASHAETPTGRALGPTFAAGTARLAETFLGQSWRLL